MEPDEFSKAARSDDGCGGQFASRAYRRTGKQPGDNVAAVEIRGLTIGFVCDSIPASMSTAAARELVGQPFLNDYRHTETWDAAIHGPVHVIACQKGVTESQAVRQLGFPDAVVVSAPFGVYVADDVQKIQMVFIVNCRDETTTHVNVQAFLNWLNDHGEAKFLVERAKNRRQISDFVRKLGDAESLPPEIPAVVAPRRRAR